MAPTRPAPTELQPNRRWEPPPRLKPASTPTAAALVVDGPPRRRIDRRIVVAAVVAVLMSVAIGLFMATRGSDPAAPTDDSVVDTGVVDPGVVDPAVTPGSTSATDATEGTAISTPDIDAGGDQP